MRTRRFWGATLASLVILVGAVSSSYAAERQLAGIVLGRSFKTVLDKYGTPDLMVPVNLPTSGALLAAAGGFGMDVFGPGGPGGAGGFPGSSPYAPPGMGGPGGFPGSSPGYGPPGMGPGGGFPGSSPYAPPGMGGPGGFPGSSPGYGPPGMGPGSGPPVLPPAGGEQPGGYGAPGGYPGAPSSGYGGYGGYGAGDTTGTQQQGNAVKWVYAQPNGGALEFWINEDGRVAQIAVSGRSARTRTARGITLGSSYSQVLKAYGPAETYRTSSVAPEVAAVLGLNRTSSRRAARDRMANYAQLYGGGVQWVNTVLDVLYPKRHHAAFTILDGKVVRITISLAD